MIDEKPKPEPPEEHPPGDTNGTRTLHDILENEEKKTEPKK
jgi:hypothetical protein